MIYLFFSPCTPLLASTHCKQYQWLPWSNSHACFFLFCTVCIPQIYHKYCLCYTFQRCPTNGRDVLGRWGWKVQRLFRYSWFLAWLWLVRLPGRPVSRCLLTTYRTGTGNYIVTSPILSTSTGSRTTAPGKEEIKDAVLVVQKVTMRQIDLQKHFNSDCMLRPSEQIKFVYFEKRSMML